VLQEQLISAVLEIYQDWCGPCKPLKEMSKRLFFEYADKGLKFYTCEAGVLKRTREFKGNCKPQFLFYRDGAELTDLKISGVNYPQMVDTVTKLLNP
jgi:thiol-disulfide isomerase/thioredoxin